MALALGGDEVVRRVAVRRSARSQVSACSETAAAVLDARCGTPRATATAATRRGRDRRSARRRRRSRTGGRPVGVATCATGRARGRAARWVNARAITAGTAEVVAHQRFDPLLRLAPALPITSATLSCSSCVSRLTSRPAWRCSIDRMRSRNLRLRRDAPRRRRSIAPRPAAQARAGAGQPRYRAVRPAPA